ncbi:hypothetical protein BC941DRAFT_495711 [Chlamydoabsidia padenii]|nr:hypothetical protein BC941DRAFT_495711 [Chlamydoabsidia padenii]
MTNSSLQQMATDIQVARQQATFPVKELTKVLYGGELILSVATKLRAIMEKEPLLDKSKLDYMSRAEMLHHSLLVHKRLLQMVEEEGLSEVEFQGLVLLSDAMSPLGLHYSAFIPVIQSQGTDEQVEKWVEPAKKLAIMGCYAQTELGHGSNVQGLRTTATLDTNTDEFIIHTPDLTAAKWWVGGLGISSSHCALQAQLMIDGKSFGPHIFIVPVRSPVNLKPLKGVTVGDIGPKAYGGFANVDNGFALFDHVRIPRENMLMRFAQVTRDGQYIRPVHDKLSYGSMVKLRVGMVADAGVKLGKAATIAIRYGTVRRQFHDTSVKDATLEQQVINYSSVKHRLFPLVAVAYALLFAGQSVSAQFQKMTQQLLKQDASMLPEMHITTCSLKVWCTRRSTDGQEECRKAMGGHGYSVFSGVGQLFATAVPSNTYEGDNYVLCQQVGRALLKQLDSVSRGTKIESTNTSYLNLLITDTPHAPYKFIDANQDILEPKVQENLFGLRAARLVADLGYQLKSGRSWSDVNIECWNVCFAHAEYNLVRQFNERVASVSANTPSLAKTMTQLANLFAVSIVAQSSIASFLSTGTIQSKDLDAIQAQFRQLLDNVAVNAVPLTDAFGFSDRELASALGSYDGRAYERLWEAVQKNPLNNEAGRKEIDAVLFDMLHHGDNLKISSKL